MRSWCAVIVRFVSDLHVHRAENTTLSKLSFTLPCAAIVFGLGCALVQGIRTKDRGLLLVFLLAIDPFLALPIPDMVNGCRRSTALRYLTVAGIGLQLVAARGLATLISSFGRSIPRIFGLLTLSGTLTLGAVSSCLQTRLPIWDKGIPRFADFPYAPAAVRTLGAERILALTELHLLLSLNRSLPRDTEFVRLDSYDSGEDLSYEWLTEGMGNRTRALLLKQRLKQIPN